MTSSAAARAKGRPVCYLDHNATTPVRPQVLEAMLPYLREDYGNPNSDHRLGQRARKAVERSREEVAALLGAAEPGEIVFTSCGSEADVAALSGAAWAAFDDSSGSRRRIVSTRIEHEAVQGALRVLARRGFEAVSAGCDSSGLVDPDEAARLIDDRTAVVSVMLANNEVGTIQPVAAVAEAARGRGALMHTDAVQAAGKVRVDVKALGVDLLALSGHKVGAPKGIGALFVRRGVRLVPTITGHQESNRRGGTENVSMIVALGAACALARRDLDSEPRRLEGLRSRLVEGTLRVRGAKLNGHAQRRLPSCAHFSFEGLSGHELVIALDLEGICVSSGPACSSGDVEPSHVLSAMGQGRAQAGGALRVSLGWSSREADVDRFLKALPGAVERLRGVAAGR
jgi:cysteine desulfurase